MSLAIAALAILLFLATEKTVILSKPFLLSALRA